MEWQQVIITGASSGLGEAFAQRLAGECRLMVLSARRVERLEALANSLRTLHPQLEIWVLPCDLSDDASRAGLLRRLQELPPACRLLVNNAGLGDYGEFSQSSSLRNRQMMQVNMAAIVELTHAMLPAMQSQGGGIINMASLAADLAIPDFAMYAATKSFVASFSEALRLEWKGRGIAVTAVCPGPVHTGFGEVARREGCSGNEMPLRHWFYTPISTVVEEALVAVACNKARCYPSMKIRLAGLLIRNLPLWGLRLVMGRRPRKVHHLKGENEHGSPT